MYLQNIYQNLQRQHRILGMDELTWSPDAIGSYCDTDINGVFEPKNSDTGTGYKMRT